MRAKVNESPGIKSKMDDVAEAVAAVKRDLIGELGFTAAIVVRSLLAAERSSVLVGVLAGWVVDRLVVCWPVSWDVVVAVDIGTCDLLERWTGRLD